jgi:Transglutaminase-like superfamily
MFSLFLQAYGQLIRFDIISSRRGFAALCNQVRSQTVQKMPAVNVTPEQVCAAVDLACIWYWKRVLCLQRSVTAGCLLKQFGVRAEVVIGAQNAPFRAHAWVEIEGRVVNDKSYIPEDYQVLERC